MMVVDCNTCRLCMSSSIDSPVCVCVNHQTDQHSTVCWEFLPISMRFTPVSWDLEVALRQNQELLSDTKWHVLVVLFSRMPPNIPQTLNQEFGGLGRAWGIFRRYIGAFLQSTSWCIVIMVCHSPTVGVWSCPRLTALLDQGAPRAKLVETIGHMVAASQASWHQRSGQNQTFQNHGQYKKWLIGFACSIWYAVDPWIVL